MIAPEILQLCLRGITGGALLGGLVATYYVERDDTSAPWLWPITYAAVSFFIFVGLATIAVCLAGVIAAAMFVVGAI